MSLDAESYLSGIYQTNVIDFNGYALTFRDGFCNQVSSGRGPLCVNFCVCGGFDYSILEQVFHLSIVSSFFIASSHCFSLRLVGFSDGDSDRAASRAGLFR